MPKRLPLIVSALTLAAMWLLAVPIFAQFGVAVGNLHGKVVDEHGGVLPGVSVTLTGLGAPQVVFTDSRGEFHFLNLPPGKYALTLALPGFSTLNRENVAVNVGRGTELAVTMALSSVAATVTVTGESPVLDTRNVQTGATVTQEELKKIPTARDPWVVLQTIPGVQLDRVNVAGSESGQQGLVGSKGTTGVSFTVDGVNMTDMSAAGSSAGYYDFDSFQEMQVITGGIFSGGGTSLNMVTKRGTNEVHGSARVFAVDEHFQSDNLPNEAKTQAVPLAEGNHIQSIQDYGVEAGGPVWKDHLWLWGAYGRDQINLVTAGGVQDKTTLEDFNAKLNWQFVSSNSATVWYLRSDKLKFGRLAGLTHPQPTTWDQITPANTWKVEDSQVFSSSLFASVQYSGQNGDFQLKPEGGLQTQTFLDEGGVWHNTYAFYKSPRPQRQVKADVSYFFNTGSLGHELKAGFGYLKAGVSSTTGWPGSGSGGLAAKTYGDLLDCSAGAVFPCAVITRDGQFSDEAKYYSVSLGDTLTWDRLTVIAGVGWARQFGENLPSTIPANATFPDIMPALNYQGRSKDFTFEDYPYQFGLTYAMGANRTTLIKASYARFTGGLGLGTIAATNPLAGVSYAYYAWNDANGDKLVQPGEVDTSANGFQYSRNRNDACPSCVGQPTNGIDPNLKAPRTDEILVGVDHELLPGFAVGVNYTYRKFKDFLYSPLSVYDPATGRVLTSADYLQYATLTGTLPDGTPYSEPVYHIRDDVVAALGGVPSGSFTFNRKNFNTTYKGVELLLTKRLANGWMARGSFVYNNNKQHVGAGGCIDPTNLLSFAFGQTCRDNDVAAVQGVKESVFLNSKWQFSVLGVYQLPLGFEVAANLYGRQGYPINWYLNSRAPIGSGDRVTRLVAVSSADSQRYENVYEFDLRAAKVVNITASATLTLSADLFNLTNENTVLQRFNQLGLDNTNNIKEIQSPRIWRFGARISF